MPISAVHPIFTAAIIHLLDLKTAPPHEQSGAMQRLSICIKALYEMNETWDWANRSLRAILSLATQWKIDVWASGLAGEISEVNHRSFERYSRDCLSPRQIPDEAPALEATAAEMFDEAFNFWSFDQNGMDTAFNLFNYDQDV